MKNKTLAILAVLALTLGILFLSGEERVNHASAAPTSTILKSLIISDLKGSGGPWCLKVNASGYVSSSTDDCGTGGAGGGSTTIAGLNPSNSSFLFLSTSTPGISTTSPNIVNFGPDRVYYLASNPNGFITATSTAFLATTTPPGADTQILFNNNGTWGADSGLTYDKSQQNLSVEGPTIFVGGGQGNLTFDPDNDLFSFNSFNAGIGIANGNAMISVPNSYPSSSVDAAFAIFPESSSGSWNFRIRNRANNADLLTLNDAGALSLSGVRVPVGTGASGTLAYWDSTNNLVSLASTTQYGRVLTATSTYPYITWATSTAPAGGGITDLNGQTGATQTFASSGPALLITSSGDTHTWSVPTSTASVTGALTGADWTTFNAKESALTFTTNLIRASNTISVTSTPTFTAIKGYEKCDIDFVIENPSASEDNYMRTFLATSTITRVFAVNKTLNDTVTWNLRSDLSRQSSNFNLLAANQATTATTTPSQYTSFASSTIAKNAVMRFITSAASSSQFGLTVCYQEN